MKKWFCCMLLSVLLMIPSAVVQAEEWEDSVSISTEEVSAEEAKEEKIAVFQGETIFPDVELPEQEELFDGYLEKLFYGEEGLELFGTEAGKMLKDDNRLVYRKLVPYIRDIAAGERTVAVVALGQPFVDEEGEEYTVDTEVVFSGGLNDFDMQLVLEALLADMPYEFYWFEKTVGVDWWYALDEDGDLYWIEFFFTVANQYVDGNPYFVDTSAGKQAAEALANAEEILEKYEDGSDYEKICGYRDEICKLTDYDWDAVENDTHTIDSSPWELISVFDGDNGTKSVCEGYSKAFQYLMDQSEFESTATKSYIVAGRTTTTDLTTEEVSSPGAHMWNIVTLNDESYLVDVTNSDEEAVGWDGSLFLAGTEQGSVADGYTFIVDDGYQTCLYEYEDVMLDLRSKTVLTLAETGYDPSLGVDGTKLPAPKLVRLTEPTELDGWLYPKNYAYYTDIPSQDVLCEICVYAPSGALFCKYTDSGFRADLDDFILIDPGIYAEEPMVSGTYRITAQFLPAAGSEDEPSDIRTVRIGYTYPKAKYDTPTVTWTEDEASVTLPEGTEDCWVALELAYFSHSGEKEKSNWYEGDIDQLMGDFFAEYEAMQARIDAEGWRGGCYRFRARVSSGNINTIYHSDWSEWSEAQERPAIQPTTADVTWTDGIPSVLAAGYDDGVKVIAAQYNEAGKCLSMTWADAANGYDLSSFVKLSAATEAKVYLFDEDMQPLCQPSVCP